MRLKTKTDAKGQVFNYSYDGYNRLTQISAGSTVLRTYVYDTNTDDSQYSQYPSGRLVEVKYTAVGYSVDTSGTPGSTMFTDMFSYTQAGQVAGKRLRLTQTMRQTNPNTHQQFTQTATGDLNLAYAYNNEGKVTQVTYPTENSITPIFSYSYDSMMRLSSMTDGSNYSQPVVNGAVYNAANQLAALNYYDTNETRAYNNLLQLTNVTASSQYYPSTSINVTYNYTPGGDSGKITSTQDAISGEAVVYQYDASEPADLGARQRLGADPGLRRLRKPDQPGGLRRGAIHQHQHDGKRQHQPAQRLHLRRQRQPDLDRLHLRCGEPNELRQRGRRAVFL